MIAPLSILSPRALIWLLVIGGVIGFLKTPNKNIFTQNFGFFNISILCLIAWGALSTIWSINPLDSILLSARLLLIFLFGFFWCQYLLNLETHQRQKISNMLFYGVVISLFFLLIDYLLGNPWQHLFNKSPAKALAQASLTFSLVLWPCAWHLYKKFNIGVAILFIIFLYIILKFLDCDSGRVAIIMGIIGYVFFQLLPKLSMKLGFLLIPTLSLTAPFLTLLLLTPHNIETITNNLHEFSYIHRLHIWRSVSEKIIQKPILGYGLDSSRNPSFGDEEVSWKFIEKTGEILNSTTSIIPMHPHNAPLQWWLELGGIGALLGTILMLKFLKLAQSLKRRSSTATAMALFCSTCVIAWVNLGFWQNWWLATLWLIGGLLAMMLSPHQSEAV